jgi:hypothetical protein
VFDDVSWIAFRRQTSNLRVGSSKLSERAKIIYLDGFSAKRFSWKSSREQMTRRHLDEDGGPAKSASCGRSPVQPWFILEVWKAAPTERLVMFTMGWLVVLVGVLAMHWADGHFPFSTHNPAAAGWISVGSPARLWAIDPLVDERGRARRPRQP